jgi:hypothetical protein
MERTHSAAALTVSPQLSELTWRVKVSYPGLPLPTTVQVVSGVAPGKLAVDVGTAADGADAGAVVDAADAAAADIESAAIAVTNTADILAILSMSTPSACG